MGLLIDSTACIYAPNATVRPLNKQLSAADQRIPTSDLLIASTALSYSDAVVTGDLRHCNRVSGLTVYHLT